MATLSSRIAVPERVDIEFETNGRGWIGYLAELPGACIRGASETECLSKVDDEIIRYVQWLGLTPKGASRVSLSNVFRSDLCVEDADNSILLQCDRDTLEPSTFDDWCEIAAHSGICFQELYDAAPMRDWRDPARDRKTFIGDCPCSIQEVYRHVNRVQEYYLACVGIRPDLSESGFVPRRQECLSRLAERYATIPDETVCGQDGEEWTLAKVLRRYIWHDRIHAKSIVRTLQRLTEKREIDPCEDPFKFGPLITRIRSDLLQPDL